MFKSQNSAHYTWTKNGETGEEPKVVNWSSEQGQDLLYTVLVHTSGINYRSLLAAEARASKVEDDLIKMANEIEARIKSVFANVFGTDVEKFTSDWNELQEAVGQLEKAKFHQDNKVKNIS